MIYYFIYVLNLVAIYGILAVSLNLVQGYTGILSLAHAAFMGIGAYSTAVLLTYHGFNFFTTLLVGMVIAGFISWGLARVTLRLKGDYYVIASFGFQIIMYNIFLNCVDITRGPYGVSHIPAPQVFGLSFQGRAEYLILTLVLLALVLWIARRIGESPYGKVLRAIREDEVAVASIGKNVTRYKIVIFIVGAMLASIGGALYACLITFVDPYTFTVHESIFILALVIIGGTGNVYGSLVGAAFLISFPEVLRFFDIPVNVASPLREIFYGALMILFLRFRPKGLLPERISMGVKHS